MTIKDIQVIKSENVNLDVEWKCARFYIKRNNMKDHAIFMTGSEVFVREMHVFKTDIALGVTELLLHFQLYSKYYLSKLPLFFKGI